MFSAYGDVVSNTAAPGSTGTGDVSRGANADGSYTLTIPGDAFTNTLTTRLDLQIVKTDSADASKLLEGAKFTLKEQGTENSMEVTTGKDGIALFEGIRRNTTYDLRETQAPSNYMTAGPWILEVRDEDATLYPATENPDGTLEKTSDTDTGTALTVTTGTDSKVLQLTIQDTLWGYKLPDTGGAGTTSYTAGGLALIFGAATCCIAIAGVERRMRHLPDTRKATIPIQNYDERRSTKNEMHKKTRQSPAGTGHGLRPGHHSLCL